jgi:hypothetical protein
MRSTHTRWAMFSPLLADQVIDISDMSQSIGSNKHIWRISRLIYPKFLLASCILLSWLKIYLIDISLSTSLKMSSDKLYSDAVRSGSSDEDVASPNRWEICLRMRYILRGLRERDLGRVNTVI